MTEPLAQLLALLDVEQVDTYRFRGTSPSQHAFTRIFGGQLFAQMLVAADKTVGTDRDVHSMHAYFLRPGDQRVPIDFEVQAGLDGRTLSNRRVVARQNGKEICNLAASFAVAADGPEFQQWQPTVPDLGQASPHIDFDEQYGEVMNYIAANGAVEFRFEEGILNTAAADRGRWRVWARVLGNAPARQVENCALVAYISDMFLLETSLRPHDAGWLDDIDFATIDFSMWFHRNFRLDGWHLMSFGAALARAGRALTYGELFSADRVAIASMTQEGMTRWKPGRSVELSDKISEQRATRRT